MSRSTFRRSVSRRPFGMEMLEFRTLLAGDVFQSIADGVTDGVAGKLAEVRDQVDAAASDLLLPVVGEQLPAAANLLEQARGALDTAMTNLAGFAGDPAETDVKMEIAEALMAVDLLGDRDGNSHLDLNDVDVNYNPKLDTIDIHLDLFRNVQTASPENVTFDVGLPSLPFYVIGQVDNVEVSFGIEYADLHFGVDSNGVFLDLDTPGDELTFHVDAGLSDDFVLEGAIGFIHGSLAAADDPTGLSAQIGIDLNSGAPTFNASGSSEINLQLNADIISGGNVSFPGVSAVLHVGANDLAAVPVVEFRDVGIDFTSKFMQPIVETLEPILAAAGRLVDALNADIPVVSDLSEAVTGQSVSVLSIVETVANWNLLSPEYDAIAEGIVSVANIIDILDQFEAGDDDTVHINFGDFAIAGDPRSVPAAGDITNISDDPPPLSQLELDPDSFDASAFNFAWLQAAVDELPPELNLLKQNLTELFDQLENSVKLTTPLLDNPGQGIFKLLLGQDVDVFRLEAHFNPTGEFGGNFELPIGIDTGLEGTVEPEFDLEFGYDTFGLRTLVSDIHNGGAGQAADLLAGLYFGQDTQFRLAAGINASVGFNALVFHADVTGGVNGELLIEVPDDANANSDGKVRIRTEDGLNGCLFDVSGAVVASLTATAQFGAHFPVIGFVGIEKEHVIASKELIGFDFTCVADPWEAPSDPNLAAQSDDGTLVLNWSCNKSKWCWKLSIQLT